MHAGHLEINLELFPWLKLNFLLQHMCSQNVSVSLSVFSSYDSNSRTTSWNNIKKVVELMINWSDFITATLHSSIHPITSACASWARSTSNWRLLETPERTWKKEDQTGLQRLQLDLWCEVVDLHGAEDLTHGHVQLIQAGSPTKTRRTGSNKQKRPMKRVWIHQKPRIFTKN